MNLRDLQEQIEGEAHFIFSGQVVRGDMFYANPSLKKAQLRVPQLLQYSKNFINGPGQTASLLLSLSGEIHLPRGVAFIYGIHTKTIDKKVK